MTNALRTCLLLVFSSASLAAQQPLRTNWNAPPDPANHVAKASETEPLSFEGKARYFAGQLFNPWNVVTPALSAGFEMASPGEKLPREWRQGAGAFGRLYGTGLSSLASTDTARFLSGALLREDPRYFRADTDSKGGRLKHALLFTIVDRSDSGHRTIAVSNFIGAAAGGTVANLYIPSPYNDPRYAVSRSAVVLGYLAASNVAKEFNPELKRLRKKLHLP